MKWSKAGNWSVVSDCGKYYIPWANVMGALVFSAVAGNTILETARVENPRDGAAVTAAKQRCIAACMDHKRGLLRTAQQ